VDTNNIELVLPELANSRAPLWGINNEQIITSGLTFNNTGSGGEYTIDAWDSLTGEYISGTGKQGPHLFETLALDTVNHVIYGNVPTLITVFDLETLQRVKLLSFIAPVDTLGLTIHPTKKYLAVSDSSGVIRIADLTNEQVIHEFKALDNDIYKVSWNSTGTVLASISSKGENLRLWDTSRLIDNSLIPTITPYPTLIDPNATATPKSTPNK